MSGSNIGYLKRNIGYLNSRYHKNEWQRLVSKSWAEMKALVVGINLGVLGMCKIGA
jgi:hypothetical protein